MNALTHHAVVRPTGNTHSVHVLKNGTERLVHDLGWSSELDEASVWCDNVTDALEMAAEEERECCFNELSTLLTHRRGTWA